MIIDNVNHIAYQPYKMSQKEQRQWMTLTSSQEWKRQKASGIIWNIVVGPQSNPTQVPQPSAQIVKQTQAIQAAHTVAARLPQPAKASVPKPVSIPITTPKAAPAPTPAPKPSPSPAPAPTKPAPRPVPAPAPTPTQGSRPDDSFFQNLSALEDVYTLGGKELTDKEKGLVQFAFCNMNLNTIAKLVDLPSGSILGGLATLMNDPVYPFLPSGTVSALTSLTNRSVRIKQAISNNLSKGFKLPEVAKLMKLYDLYAQEFWLPVLKSNLMSETDIYKICTEAKDFPWAIQSIWASRKVDIGAGAVCHSMETAATQELCAFLTGVYETNADIDKEIARVQQEIANAKNGDSKKGYPPLSKLLDNYKKAKSDFDKAFNATIPKIEMDPTSFLTL